MAFFESVPPGFFNDEAIELLVAEDLPFDQLYFYAPPYEGGTVNPIEALVPYLLAGWWNVLGQSVMTTHLFYALFFVLAAYLLYRVFGRRNEVAWGILASLVFSLSAYGNYFSRILVRNATSTFWSILLFTLFLSTLNNRGSRRSKLIHCLSLSVASFLAIYTYTSLLFVVAAILGTWALIYIRRKEWGELQWVLGVSIATTLLLYMIGWISHQPLKMIVSRSAYVISSNTTLETYGLYLYQALLLPFHLFDVFQQGNFFTEETHRMFGRGMLPVGTSILFFIGLWRASVSTWKGETNETLAFPIWLFSTTALSVGGPSLKVAHCTFPFVIILAVTGARFLFALISGLRGRTAAFASILLLLSAGVLQDAFHFIGYLPTNNHHIVDGAGPNQLANEALRLREKSAFVVVSSGGMDLVRWRTRSRENMKFIMPSDVTLQSLNEQIEKTQPFSFVQGDPGSPPATRALRESYPCHTAGTIFWREYTIGHWTRIDTNCYEQIKRLKTDPVRPINSS